MDKRNRTNTNTSNSSATLVSNNSKTFKQVITSTINSSSSNIKSIESDNIDEAFSLRLFDNKDFDVDSYVKNVALKSIDSNDLLKTKDQLSKLAEKTAEEIKLSVYNNYTNFMDTAKEVGHLEGKMAQLKQSLDEQKKLISLFKNLNVNSNNNVSSNSQQTDQQKTKQTNQQPTQKRLSIQNGSLAKLLEEVEGCSVITQKPGREIIFDGDLELLDTTDFNVLNKIHAYLLNDALLLTVPQRKRTKNSNFKAILMNNLDNKHQYKFQAFYELQDITISNIADRKEVRNSFQVYKFPESVVFRCTNAHSKKEWLERIEQTKKQLENTLSQSKVVSLSNGTRKNENLNFNKSKTILEEDESTQGGGGDGILSNSGNDDFNRNKYIRDQFSDFDIFLAQRDFEKAVDLLIRIKSSNVDSTSIQQLVYKQKETELITMLRKDLNISKERGNKGIQKTGKRVVNCLVKLKIYDEALNLFIDYHKTLNSESLKKIKLEESNSIYMNNVMNLFFDNLRLSYNSFKDAFQLIFNFSLSTYLNWTETEIEILIRKLQSQHYIGRQFDLTIENCELIFDRAAQYSKKNFEVKFFFETKLRDIIEKSIKEQKSILMEASLQRSKTFDGGSAQVNTQSQNEQNRQTQVQKFLNDLDSRGLRPKTLNRTSSVTTTNGLLAPSNNSLRSQSPSIQNGENNIFNFNLNTLNPSAIQFSRGILNFFCDILRIYYHDLNYTLNEAIVGMFKLELSIYAKNITEKSNDPVLLSKYKSIAQNNLNFIFYHLLPLIEKLYSEKTKLESKNLKKLHERYKLFKTQMKLDSTERV
jgi:hypothetical protein